MGSLSVTVTAWRRITSVEAFRRRPNNTMHQLEQPQSEHHGEEQMQVHNYNRNGNAVNNKTPGNRSSIITVENLESDNEQQWKNAETPLSATTTMTTLHI